MARYRRSTSRQGPRRTTEWIGGENVLADPTGLSENSVAIHMATISPWAGTIIRVRGYFKAWTDQVVASETPFGAIGICVVSREAWAAGAASIPAPYTDSGSDKWLYHSYFGAPYLFGANGIAGAIADIEIDSKAMRKLTFDDAVVWMIENQSATDAMLYLYNTRYLMKLA